MAPTVVLKIGPKIFLKIGPKVVLKIGSGSGPRAGAGLHSFDMCASCFFCAFFSLFVCSFGAGGSRARGPVCMCAQGAPRLANFECVL